MATPREVGEAGDEAIDFLVIGAPKAGTTSLFEYLRGHPELDLPPDKEAPYFSDDQRFAKLNWGQYLSWAFPVAKRGRLAGTITPQYMSPITGIGNGADGSGPASQGYDDYTLPRRIYDRLPTVSLIAILRDPVERAFSHHRQETRRGFETRPFAEAVDELLQPEALARCRAESTRTNCYVVLGEYGRIFDAYCKVFPREQLLFLFTDELARKPLDVLRRIYGFLDVSPDYKPRNLGKRYNVSGSEARLSLDAPATAVKIASANRLARAIWHSLSDERKKAMLVRYRRFNFRFRNWNRRDSEPAAARRPDDVSAALERLREHYAPDERLLAEVLGYSPSWTTADGAVSPEAVRK